MPPLARLSLLSLLCAAATSAGCANTKARFENNVTLTTELDKVPTQLQALSECQTLMIKRVDFTLDGKMVPPAETDVAACCKSIEEAGLFPAVCYQPAATAQTSVAVVKLEHAQRDLPHTGENATKAFAIAFSYLMLSGAVSLHHEVQSTMTTSYQMADGKELVLVSKGTCHVYYNMFYPAGNASEAARGKLFLEHLRVQNAALSARFLRWKGTNE